MPDVAIRTSAPAAAPLPAPPDAAAPAAAVSKVVTPEEVDALVGPRVSAARAEAGVAELRTRVEALKDLDVKLSAEVASLEASIKARENEINQKMNEVSSLRSQASSLRSRISSKRDKAAAFGIAGTLLAFTGFGAVAGAYAAGATAIAIKSLSDDLANVDRRLSSASSDETRLRNAKAALDAQLKAAKTKLDSLKRAEAGLRQSLAAIPQSTPEPRALIAERDVREQIIGVLRAQISLLQSTDARASQFSAALDDLIAAMKKDVEKLEETQRKADMVIAGLIFDIAAGIAIAARGVTAIAGGVRDTVVAAAGGLEKGLAKAIPGILTKMISAGVLPEPLAARLAPSLVGLAKDGLAAGDQSFFTSLLGRVADPVAFTKAAAAGLGIAITAEAMLALQTAAKLAAPAPGASDDTAAEVEAALKALEAAAKPAAAAPAGPSLVSVRVG